MSQTADPWSESVETLAWRLAKLPYRRLGVLGDSLSAGTGDPTPGYEPTGWAQYFVQALRLAHPGSTYLNTAVVGAKTPDILRQQADRIRDFAPDLLHLPSGANDIATRQPDYQQIEDDLRTVYEFGKGTGARLVTFTLGQAYNLRKIPGFSDRVRRVNEIIRSLAPAYAVIVVDMWFHPVNTRPDLLSADQIHFAGMGQAVMATEVAMALEAAAHEQ